MSLPIFFTRMMSLELFSYKWPVSPSVTYAGITTNPLSEDYIRTARAKGLPEHTVIIRHALRATITPVITMFGMDVGALLGGAILTDRGFPGRSGAHLARPPGR